VSNDNTLRQEHEQAMTAHDVVLATFELVGWMNTRPTGTRKGEVPEGYSYGVQEGQRYLKIWMDARGSKSVHAFVDKRNGDLLKAASWKAPAKGARGNVLDEPLYDIFARFDWTGRYLYR
jgi:hypothetical protein